MQIPDVATKFTYKGSSFRVDGYMKAEPLKPVELRPGAHDAIAWELMREMFFKHHPNWHNEYRLVWCRKEEATHVTGVGIAGCIVAINDPEVNFTYEYVSWPKERIEEAKNQALWFAKEQEKDSLFSAPYEIVTGDYHE